MHSTPRITGVNTFSLYDEQYGTENRSQLSLKNEALYLSSSRGSVHIGTLLLRGATLYHRVSNKRVYPKRMSQIDG